jgi:hypothetical protein
MAAITSDLNHSLVCRIAAMIAAIFIVAAHHTAATLVPASVIVVCHFLFPPARKNLLARSDGLIIIK